MKIGDCKKQLNRNFKFPTEEMLNNIPKKKQAILGLEKIKQDFIKRCKTFKKNNILILTK